MMSEDVWVIHGASDSRLSSAHSGLLRMRQTVRLPLQPRHAFPCSDHGRNLQLRESIFMEKGQAAQNPFEQSTSRCMWMLAIVAKTVNLQAVDVSGTHGCLAVYQFTGLQF